MAVKFGVRDVLRTRLDALPTQLRQLAEAAATAGEPIASVVLAQMLDIGPWELADQLDALVGKGVLTARRRGLAFAHDLVAEVIYESLPPARRLLLHERAAHALTVGNAMSLDEVSGQIAAHLEAAGQETSAIPHHERAAEAACRAHAHQTAIHHYQRLRVLVPADQRTAVLLRLGELLSYGAAEEAEVLYRDGLRSASRHGDGHAQARCYFALGVLLRRRSDLAGSLAALTEALRRFQAYGDTEGVERTLEALTYAYIQHGDLAAATSAASQAADIASDTGRLQNLGRATLSRGIAHFYGGEHERALDCFEVARTMAVDTADELAEAEALRYVSAVYGADGSCGTPLQAWAAADRSIEICVRLGHRMGLSRAADGAGGAYLLAGDWQSALDCYVGALHLTDTVGYVWGSDALVYRIGHTLLLGGENKRAARALAHAEALSRKLIAPYWLCRTFLAESELAIRESNHQEAAAHASSALDLARQLNHHEFIGKATALLDHAAQGTCAVTVRVVTARAATPGSESADRLPAVPKRLDVPVRGVAAVSDWLDDVVHRQLAALPERR
jgi:tetratricopeptide (TPR) repeat protein